LSTEDHVISGADSVLGLVAEVFSLVDDVLSDVGHPFSLADYVWSGVDAAFSRFNERFFWRVEQLFLALLHAGS